MPNHIFPWQMAEMELLLQAKKANRLPHALLLMSRNVNAEIVFAKAFAALMLCTGRNPPDSQSSSTPFFKGGENIKPVDQSGGFFPCNICHACRLFDAGSHPDFILIEPEGSSIKIDQMRDMITIAQETAMQGGYRIICIAKAHLMNLQAANALLKTLEEPTPHTLLILISDQSARLPATILSRCQKIIFKNPTRACALDWLKRELGESSMEECELLLNMAEGSPFTALEYKTHMPFRERLYQGLIDLFHQKQDPLQLALLLQEYDVTICFHLLHYWLRDMLRYQLSGGEALLMNSDLYRSFAVLSPKIITKHLLEYMDIVMSRHKNYMMSQSLNKLLLFEELFIRWLYLSSSEFAGS